MRFRHTHRPVRRDPDNTTFKFVKNAALVIAGSYFQGRIYLSVDLHCHTKLSNSSMGIDDLIMLAKKRGVDTISITDHDCQAGSVRAES